MADVESTSVPLLAVTAAVGAVVLLIVLLCGVGRKQDDESKHQEEEETSGENGAVKKPLQGKKKEKPNLRKRDSKPTFSHPWLAGSLKGHSSAVLGLDFSPNGKYLASCAEERTVLIWNTKDFSKREHKSVRANVELDHASQIKFSPDSKAFIIALYNANTVRVMKMGKKDDGSIGNFQTAIDFKNEHNTEIINIGIASSGKYIMTCFKDTLMKIWDLKGEILSTIDTNQMYNYFGAVSPCGRFVGSSGFTPDVKVWEVCFDKGGNFRDVTRAFELTGHSAGIYCFSFSADSRRMATISKDGTWKLWDTNVEYQKNQDPHLLMTEKFDHQGPSLVALAPNATTVATASGNKVSIFDAYTGQCDIVIEDPHTSTMTSLCFDLSSQYLVSSGDRNIHLFHNMTGYRALISDFQEKKKKAGTSAHRERLQQQIDEAKKNLAAIEGANKS